MFKTYSRLILWSDSKHWGEPLWCFSGRWSFQTPRLPGACWRCPERRRMFRPVWCWRSARRISPDTSLVPSWRTTLTHYSSLFIPDLVGFFLPQIQLDLSDTFPRNLVLTSLSVHGEMISKNKILKPILLFSFIETYHIISIEIRKGMEILPPYFSNAIAEIFGIQK